MLLKICLIFLISLPVLTIFPCFCADVYRRKSNYIHPWLQLKLWGNWIAVVGGGFAKQFSCQTQLRLNCRLVELGLWQFVASTEINSETLLPVSRYFGLWQYELRPLLESSLKTPTAKPNPYWTQGAKVSPQSVCCKGCTNCFIGFT